MSTVPISPNTPGKLSESLLYAWQRNQIINRHRCDSVSRSLPDDLASCLTIHTPRNRLPPSEYAFPKWRLVIDLCHLIQTSATHPLCPNRLLDRMTISVVRTALFIQTTTNIILTSFNLIPRCSFFLVISHQYLFDHPRSTHK